MDDAAKLIFSVATAIVGVAIVAVIVSRNSATSDVIKSAGSAFTDALKVAVSPIAAK